MLETLVTTSVEENDTEEEIDEWDLALVTSGESRDTSREASINIFKSKGLLTGIKEAERKVLLAGFSAEQ
jgi:hypothetical protein